MLHPYREALFCRKRNRTVISLVTVQLTSNRNMITSVPGLPETGLPLILIKLKKLFFYRPASRHL